MKRVKSLSLLIAMLVTLSCLAVPASAAEMNDNAAHAASILYELGLFRGVGTNPDGTPNFDLNRAPTREEAVVMLVRLLGKEKEAIAGTWATPFNDVSDWAKPYVGYAYAKKLTYGVSPMSFGGKQIVSATQYLTFVLRALGYSSDTDFYWDAAWEASDYIGVTAGEYNEETTTFTRGDVAIISESSLYVKMKSSRYNLLTNLNDSGALAGSKLVLMDLDVVSVAPNRISFAFFPFEGSPNTYSEFTINSVKVFGSNCEIVNEQTTPETAQSALKELILVDNYRYPIPSNYTKAFNYTTFKYAHENVKLLTDHVIYMPNGDIFPVLEFNFEYTGTLHDGTTVTGTFSANYFSMHDYYDN